MDSLNSSTYPFRNCPVDILRLVFEAAVSRDEAGFQTATNISHVSQYWRNVTLSTPSLWSYVGFSMLKPVEDTMEFLEQIYGRIGTRAVLLVVKDIPRNQISTLRSFELKRISNMEWLKLNFSGAPPGAWPSLSEALNRPNIDLTKLVLTFKPDYSRGHSRQAERFGAFPPNLRYLNINGEYFMDVEFTESYLNVQYLSLRSVRFSLVDVVQCFPNLEVLETINLLAGSIRAVDTELELPRLKKLKICRLQSTGWLRSLSCPVLTELWIKQLYEFTKVIAFIKRHGSITTLKVYSGSITQELMDAAPQLQHLTIQDIGNEFCTVLHRMDKLEGTDWSESELVKEARVWTEKNDTTVL